MVTVTFTQSLSKNRSGSEFPRWWGRRTLPHDGRDTRPPPPRRLLGAGRLWRGQPQPPAGCAQTSSVAACGIKGVSLSRAVFADRKQGK